ncbi:chaperone protein dnaJ 49-like [Cornus florida]|uniref:chaperone protein dnaJ 49-like n=1 Tax=Cornus florida TaxID=4283 RepID=UPI00289949B5|nr:chaperone protein dnaJ 49-like [Cornus florida]
MDGNKDDALKCLKISRDALEAGDRTRALKFINKARRLDPSLPIEDLLSKLEGKSGDPSSNGPTNESSSDSSKMADINNSNSGTRRRASATGSSAGSSSTTSVAYTEEQISIVREIKRKKDYYEILGLEKSCSVEDVRKAYRKLSLKVHPDKNNAPGAEEAFKAVSKAFQCLSVEESRKKYDLVGSDEPVYERHTTRRAAQGFNGFYEAEFDADEIFRNFFFGGMNPAATTQFRGFNFGPGVGARMGDQGSGGFNVRALIQLLPVLLILLVNFLPSSDPIYTLSRTYPYEHRFTTQKGVNFYVKTTKFEQDYPPNSPERVAIEERVEKDYYSLISQNCRLELQRLQWGFTRETPYCDMLKRFEKVA